jgi:hypothetical protein
MKSILLLRANSKRELNMDTAEVSQLLMDHVQLDSTKRVFQTENGHSTSQMELLESLRDFTKELLALNRLRFTTFNLLFSSKTEDMSRKS